MSHNAPTEIAAPLNEGSVKRPEICVSVQPVASNHTAEMQRTEISNGCLEEGKSMADGSAREINPTVCMHGISISEACAGCLRCEHGVSALCGTECHMCRAALPLEAVAEVVIVIGDEEPSLSAWRDYCEAAGGGAWDFDVAPHWRAVAEEREWVRKQIAKRGGGK